MMGNRRGILKSGYFWSFVLFFAVIVFINLGVESVSETVSTQQQQLLETAVRRSAIQCYVLEGSYPPDINYLEENYGLFYERGDYVVHYQNIGGNLLPEIAVFYIGGDGEV